LDWRDEKSKGMVVLLSKDARGSSL